MTDRSVSTQPQTTAGTTEQENNQRQANYLAQVYQTEKQLRQLRTMILENRHSTDRVSLISSIQRGLSALGSQMHRDHVKQYAAEVIASIGPDVEAIRGQLAKVIDEMIDWHI